MSMAAPRVCGRERSFRAVARVVDLARELAVQPVEIALRRVLDAPGVGAVSFGSRNISHVEGSYAASRWRMSAEQWEFRGDRRP